MWLPLGFKRLISQFMSAVLLRSIPVLLLGHTAGIHCYSLCFIADYCLISTLLRMILFSSYLVAWLRLPDG
jgi:hypothetical protein